MALEPLAAVADLDDRNIDISDTALAETMLAVASAEVRGAAGSPVSETTSMVRLPGRHDEQYLRLPGPPVQEVESVLLEGTAVEDWRLDDGRLWRAVGWGIRHGPNRVEVTYIHGFPEVPADIVDLVCSLAAAGIVAAGEGYESHRGKVSESIDDYSVTYAQGAEAVATAMDLPRRTRQRLRARLGVSAGMVTHR